MLQRVDVSVCGRPRRQTRRGRGDFEQLAIAVDDSAGMQPQPEQTSVSGPNGEERRKEETSRLSPAFTEGPWQLELASQHETKTIALSAGERLTIGSGPGVDLRLHDRWVSAKHVQLRATSRGLCIKDLGSKNGVFVGSAMVRAARLTAPYSSFVIGRTTVCANPGAEVPPTQDSQGIDGMVGRSAAMARLFEGIRRCARLSAPVLIQGESGTGKELVARALHRMSERHGEFVAINVGGLTESLADAELFGHRRGAFTGAHTARVGAFELADRGTLFLDEIAELSPSVQVKLLRVLEDGVVRPLGAERGKALKTRVVSATWRPLEQRMEEGHFRLDLFHRITKLKLHIPPLRQRRSDIVLLSEHLLRKNQELGPKELSAAALSRLLNYHWPGNVRELEHVLYRAAVAATGRVIELRDLEGAMPRGIRRRAALSVEEATRMLRAYEGNVSAAARAARVPRSTFRSWLSRKAG